MNSAIQGPLSLAGRVLLSAIFLMSAIGNKIPQFESVKGYMASQGVPMPALALVGAIVFLICGSLAVISGYQARFGAGLLAVFLVLATYYFHDFWTFPEGQARQEQVIQFMKNAALLGAMLFVIANGPGAWSWRGRTSAGS
jgi:putative oxidoreductase